MRHLLNGPASHKRAVCCTVALLSSIRFDGYCLVYVGMNLKLMNVSKYIGSMYVFTASRCARVCVCFKLIGTRTRYSAGVRVCVLFMLIGVCVPKKIEEQIRLISRQTWAQTDGVSS